jgi:hypothetical protein
MQIQLRGRDISFHDLSASEPLMQEVDMPFVESLPLRCISKSTIPLHLL